MDKNIKSKLLEYQVEHTENILRILKERKYFYGMEI